MPALHIFVADDQIPPSNVSEREFRESILAKYGPEAKPFLDQCVFMGEIVQALRDSGYRVTVARTYSDAVKEISHGEFDLAIIDLGWFMDSSLPKEERPAAGWSLCQQLDDKDEQRGKRTPQILFSSRFPKEPELSREAARRRKLPLFKEATDIVRHSLLAAVGFVDATLAVQRSASSASSSRFDPELQSQKGMSITPVFGQPLQPEEKIDVFVLMPFNAKMAKVYTHHIKKLGEELGVKIRRADEIFSPRPFMEKVWEGICAAQLILADCTEENPNVFYEIGVAHTIGKKVVLITRSDKDIPSDIKHFDYIHYIYGPKGVETLIEKLRTFLKSHFKL
jgi:CheY-like chemotaxis protein